MKNLLHIFLTVIFFVTVFNSCTEHTASNNEKGFVYRGNNKLTGVFDEKAVYGLDGIQFTFKTNGALRMMPAYYDSKLFLGSSDGNLYSISADSGNELWHFETGGAVTCTPAISNNVIFFSSRDGFLYAINATDGSVKWRKQFGPDYEYTQGWDYYLSSPVVEGDIVYAGSGDGNVYALDKNNGKEIWKYNAGCRLRTAVAIDGDNLFTGGMNGYLYALNKKDGSLKWKFETKGVTNKFEDYDYDATAILSSPSADEGVVIVGARDGFFYCIDQQTGKELWQQDHNTSWVLGTGIKNGIAYAASGSSAFVQAVDIKSGKELWRYKAARPTFSSITLADDMLYFDDYVGNVYAINNKTGKEAWVFPMGRRSFSAPLIANGRIYCGSDDGILFSLKGNSQSAFTEAKPAKKVVYWEPPKSDSSFRWFVNGVDVYVRDFLRAAGYEVMNGQQAEYFLRQQIDSPSRSVIVFANNEVPYPVLKERSSNSLLRRYLDKGGKIVFLGPDATAYINEPKNGIRVDSISFLNGPKQIFGIQYERKGNINWSPVHSTTLTEEGRKMGLRNWYVGYCPVDSSQVTTILAKNEFGKASAWLKNFGGEKGTGLLQIPLPKDVVSEMQAIRTAIEYGIKW